MAKYLNDLYALSKISLMHGVHLQYKYVKKHLSGNKKFLLKFILLGLSIFNDMCDKPLCMGGVLK
jgi:hypothetical protein